MKSFFKVLCLLFVVVIPSRGYAQSAQSKAQSLFNSGKYDDAAHLFDMTASMTQDATERTHLYDMAKRSRACLSLLQKANADYAAERWEQAKQNYQALLGSKYNPKDPLAKKRVAEITELIAKREEEKARLAEQERLAAEQARLAAAAKRAAEIAAREDARRAEADWARVDKNREQDLTTFLAKHPYAAQVPEAQKHLQAIYEEREWEMLESKESYQAFLKKYPNGNYAGQARMVLDHWNERVLWGKYLEKNSESGYKEYLSKYPSGIFASDAKKRINALQEERFWADAERANTIKDYNVFTIMFPSSSHCDEAKKRMAALEKVRLAEKRMVDQILNRPSRERVDEFIAQHPNSEWNEGLSDYYSKYLCEHINVNSATKDEFKLARAYARTADTNKRIDAKEKEWKQVRKQQKGNGVVKAIGITAGVGVGVGAIVWGAVSKAKKNAQENK